MIARKILGSRTVGEESVQKRGPGRKRELGLEKKGEGADLESFKRGGLRNIEYKQREQERR